MSMQILKKMKEGWLFKVNLLIFGLLCLALIFHREILINSLGVYCFSKRSHSFDSVFKKASDFDRCNQLFLKALEIDSSYAPAFANLGFLTRYMGTNQAFHLGNHYFQKAILLAPQKYEIYLLYYDHLIYNLRLGETVDLALLNKIIAKAKELAPNNPDVYTQLARFQGILSTKYEQAISNLKISAKLQSDISYLRTVDMGRFYFIMPRLSGQLSSIAGAIYYNRYVDEAIPIPPDSCLNWIPQLDNFYLGLAESFIGAEKYSIGLKYIKLSIKANPRNKWAPKLAGETYYLLGDYSQAIHYFKLALKLFPKMERGRLYTQLAFSFKETGEFGNAIDAFKSALAHGAPKAPLFYNLATLYALQHEKDKVFEYLEKAISEDVNYASFARVDSTFIEYLKTKEFYDLTLNAMNHRKP